MDKNNKNISFLQSAEWQKFQESVGRKTFFIKKGGPASSASSAGRSVDRFSVSIIEHELPIVGKYFYIPHGPEKFSSEILDLAKKENANWVRFDPRNETVLESIKKNTNYKIQKAPHDMQPKEIFVIDISKSEEELLAEMKQKTRYNIRLAEKKNIKIFVSREEKYIQRFCELVKITAQRDNVSVHSENYYKKMIEMIPENILKLYCAEYNGTVIAANLVVFYGETAVYFHGASDNEHRNVMAPYLLQWQAILDAKNAEFKFYDFGGISTNQEPKTKNWQGITKFKFGFSLNTEPVVFPGSYDIIINQSSYTLYKILQTIKSRLYKIIR